MGREPLQVVVVGAGIAGLAATLAFARAGHEVTLVEQDAAPPPASPDASFLGWHRPGVPQRRLVHGFLPLARKLLLTHLPDVVDRLVAVGAAHVDMLDPVIGRIPAPGDDELVVLRSRRSVFEWVMRRTVGAEPQVSIVAGDPVVGLLGSTDGVSGVRLRSAGEVVADLVVDASGRRSAVRAWLRALGAPEPEEDRGPCGLVYFCRFYEHRERKLPVTHRAVLGHTMAVATAADGRTFSITFFARAEEHGLRRLREEAAFERAVGAIPGFLPWREGAAPIGPISAMGALENTIRRFAPGGRLLVSGLIPIGDSLTNTNPTLGRGMSLGLAHAFTAASLPWARGSVVDPALEYQARVDPMAEASFADAVKVDELSRRLYAGDAAAGEEPRGLLLRAAPLAAAGDQDLFRAMARHQGLLEPPGSIAAEPWITRARVILATAPATPSLGPDLQTMLEVIEQSPGDPAPRGTHRVAGVAEGLRVEAATIDDV